MIDRRFLEALDKTIRIVRSEGCVNMSTEAHAEVMLALSYLKLEFADIIEKDTIDE
tara:strand:- start:434 stop:601 length:168 start_codon:yes stop_codon:yes gene_type:complete